jgi:pilus assembly protein CpaE
MRLMLGGMPERTARELFRAVKDLAEDAGYLQDWTLLEEACDRAQPNVVALHLGSRPAQVLGMMTRVRAMWPGMHFIAIADYPSATLVQKVTQAGCSDLVVLRECPDDLRRALSQLVQRDATPNADGMAIAVVGAKGGVGTTTVAANLADQLAQRKNARVMLVDLHLYLGDMSVMLDVKPRPSALWFLLRGSVADQRTWAEAPPTHSAGFRVLGLDGDMKTADPVSAEQVVYLVERLKERYDFVVVDCGAEINEVSLAAASAADQRLVVLTDELASRSGAKRRRDALAELELGPTPARAVLNRAHDSSDAARKALEAVIDMPVVGTIANSWQDAQGAMERGKTLRQHAPRSAATADFAALLPALAGEDQDAERRKRAFFNFFR